ncbi:alcohol dehydrogenase catalytic domain-containing protein [Candidatus Poribacteria bacterium]|nr:alcohol dehydrogenase catalytic domain-containing protein [Candidatus Poribacteria bacterium]
MISVALLHRPRDLRLAEIPGFELEFDQVMVDVAACGICGSDLRYYHGENPWALHTLGVSLPNPHNIVLGHEFAGTVTDAGGFRQLLGKRVAVMSFKTCGACQHCRGGHENLCRNTTHLGHGAGWGKLEYYPGGMADRCPAWGNLCFELPDAMIFEEAAMLDVVGVGVHAARVGGVRPGVSIAVFGAGPIGNAIMQASRAMGASRAFVVDTYEVALEIAIKCNATAAIEAVEADPVKAIFEANSGACSVVFDTVGSVDTLRKGVALLAEGGTLVNMAVHDMNLTLNSLDIGSERSIKTSCNFLPEEFPLSLSLVESGQIDVKPWITHRFPLREISKAFDVALNKEKHGAFKVIIEPAS